MPLDPPDIHELKAIVDWVNLSGDVRELSITYGDVSLFVSRDRPSPIAQAASVAAPAVPAAPAAPAPSPVQTVPVAAPEHAPAVSPAAAVAAPSAGALVLGPDEVAVTAPMVGTFYAAPKPGASPFVAVGDRVEPGSVLCIVEVMKLMNSIEAPEAGTVVRILVENEQAVEFGQPLLVISRDA